MRDKNINGESKIAQSVREIVERIRDAELKERDTSKLYATLETLMDQFKEIRLRRESMISPVRKWDKY